MMSATVISIFFILYPIKESVFVVIPNGKKKILPFQFKSLNQNERIKSTLFKILEIFLNKSDIFISILK